MWKFRELVRVAAFLALVSGARAAEPKWIKARLGSFEAISDSGRKSATEALGQFEQLRFAIGAAMGQPDLRLDPPLRILVFRNAAELKRGCFDGLRMGRDRMMVCATAEGQLSPQVLRELTKTLLETNFSAMPAPLETAFITFFSTFQSNGAHSTWGAPPPKTEQTREWAMIERITTQPEYAERAHLFLHNLAVGMDESGAIRNAFGEDPRKFEADVERFYGSGGFAATRAPNRPLNPDRDFHTTFLTSDEGELMRADLLMPDSRSIYQKLLADGKHSAEDNEGLAILAMRAGNVDEARNYIDAARKSGTKNAVALTEYAALETDNDRAIAVLKDALTADPKYAEAHWRLGEKISDPARRMMEWKQAVNLAPRRHDWWAQYARLCIEQKQYAEAGRAWMAAAQAAPNTQLREQYLTARGQIETQRLDQEDAERKKEAAARDAEINRLKAQAREELAEVEARANTNPLSKQERDKAVEWFDGPADAKVSGTLVRVICGRQSRLELRESDGRIERFAVGDLSHLQGPGGEFSIACGVQKAREVTISFRPAKASTHSGVAGEVTAIELK
jgi:tetratricopeptide (TPR) repeat protein